MTEHEHNAIYFYFLSLAIRDSLEYVQNRKDYDIQVFHNKRETLEGAFKEGSYFQIFINSNKENESAQKIKDNLANFYSFVYSAKTGFISFKDSSLVVDHKYNIEVLESVSGLEETFLDIMKMYFKSLKENNEYESYIDELSLYNDKLYRSVILMIASDLLFATFGEFNSVMRAANGLQTTKSDKLAENMKRLAGVCNFVRSKTPEEYDEFKPCFEELDHCFKVMSGEEKLQEGEKYNIKFNNLITKWFDIIKEVEPKWRELHQVAWDRALAYEQARAKKAN